MRAYPVRKTCDDTPKQRAVRTSRLLLLPTTWERQLSGKRQSLAAKAVKLLDRCFWCNILSTRDANKLLRERHAMSAQNDLSEL